MSGKSVHGMNLLGRLMELVDDVDEQTAFEYKDSVNHICNEFAVRSGNAAGNFIVFKYKRYEEENQ